MTDAAQGFPGGYDRSAIQEADGGITLFDAVGFLVRHRRRVLRWTLLGGAVAALVTLVRSREYTSQASFTTEGASRAGIAALAGQFGVAIPTGSRADSPEFYADLVRSRSVLLSIADDTLAVSELGGERVPVLRLLDIPDGPRGPSGERAVQRLSQLVTASVVRTTGVVKVSVTTRWPSVSQIIADRLLKAANAFNVGTRRSQAGEERRFIESRLAVARDSLRAAENRLKTFLTMNRQPQNSPELFYESERLKREVALQQQLYTSLTVSYEEVRAREVRDTPVITVIEPPKLPALPNPKRTWLWATIGVILGATSGVTLCVASESLERRRASHDPETAELLRLLREFKNGLLRWLPRRPGR